jgi:hypothetical protein
MQAYKITFTTGTTQKEHTAIITASTRTSAIAQLRRAMPNVAHIVYICEA